MPLAKRTQKHGGTTPRKKGTTASAVRRSARLAVPKTNDDISIDEQSTTGPKSALPAVKGEAHLLFTTREGDSTSRLYLAVTPKLLQEMAAAVYIEREFHERESALQLQQQEIDHCEDELLAELDELSEGHEGVLGIDAWDKDVREHETKQARLAARWENLHALHRQAMSEAVRAVDDVLVESGMISPG